MSTSDKKFIYIQLIGILVVSIIFLFISLNPGYDKKLYSQLYDEYNEIFDEDSNVTSVSTSTATVRTDFASPNVIGEITIPKIDIVYPLLRETTDDLLKIAPTKLWGPEPNSIGNLCIIAHNYKSNGDLFTNLSKLGTGDIVKIQGLNKKVVTYEVYKKYTISSTDMSYTSQLTSGKKELTLITCTSSDKTRLIVKCIEI